MRDDACVHPAPPPQRIDSWRTAETNAAAWMRHWGFDDAQVTPDGNDGGVDVRSSTAIAQVKREATDVGIEALQRLAGARLREHHLGLLFFSGSGYTRQAALYAETMEMMLFVYEVDGAMLAVSTKAKALLERVAQRQQPEPARRPTASAPKPRQSSARPSATSPRPVTGFPDFTSPFRPRGTTDSAPKPRRSKSRSRFSEPRPVTDFPEVVALIRQGKRDKAADAYAASAGVKRREAQGIVALAWTAVRFMPPGRDGGP